MGDLSDMPPMPPTPDLEQQGPKLREPPWSPQAEHAVLGCLMMDAGALELIGDLIGPESFYAKAHATIYRACTELNGERIKPDAVTVYLRLRETVQDESDFGGLSYINHLANCVSGWRNVRAYAQVVADKALERSAIRACEEAASVAWDGRQALTARLDRIAGTLAQVEEQRRGQRGRFPCMTLEELGRARQGIRWTVKHAVPRDSIGVLFGASGTFKSFVAIDLALHVAHGALWLGKRTDKGSVMYIAAEGQAGIYDRIDAWHRHRNRTMKGADMRVVPVAVDILTDAWRVVDRAQAVGMRPDLVVIDTLSQTFAGEENNASEMAAYFRALGRFREMWGCAVLVVHHSGHSATERPRGSSAIRANVDFMFGCFRDEREMIAKLVCLKQKDGDPLQDQEFKMHRVSLGVDEDNDPLSSLAAWHLSADEAEEAHREEAEAGRGSQYMRFLALVQSGMDESALRFAFYEGCGEAGADAKRQAYGRCRAKAKAAGDLTFDQGKVIKNAR